MRGRILVYIILLGIFGIMLYAAIRINAKFLLSLAAAGIIFSVYNLFVNPDK
jgi:hypothetical protein